MDPLDRSAVFRLITSRLVPIWFGTAVYAAGLHYLIIPNGFMEGGITGIGLLINYTLGIPLSFTNLALNVPLFLAGWVRLGPQAMGYTLYGTLVLSVNLWILEQIQRIGWTAPPVTDDPLLAVLFAGTVIGGGLGIVFRFGGTTGGVDIVARIAQKARGWSMGQFILGFDAVVIGSSLLYIELEKVMYTLVVVFIATRVIDFIQEGAYAAKAFTIITDRAQELKEAIARRLDRGVTVFPARGGYSNADKEVIYCVVYKNESRRMQTLVKETDPKAFMIISDVRDVLGEGFYRG
jgi:uncharacterized membrane-anchored protein YitT (DUF2179 family)